jgi:hypothetical protein
MLSTKTFGRDLNTKKGLDNSPKPLLTLTTKILDSMLLLLRSNWHPLIQIIV